MSNWYRTVGGRLVNARHIREMGPPHSPTTNRPLEVLAELDSGRQERLYPFDVKDSHFLPNTTGISGIHVVWRLNGDQYLVEEVPVIGWKVFNDIFPLVEKEGGLASEPVFAYPPLPNVAWCLRDGDSYWQPDGFAPCRREDALSMLREEAKRLVDA